MARSKKKIHTPNIYPKGDEKSLHHSMAFGSLINARAMTCNLEFIFIFARCRFIYLIKIFIHSLVFNFVHPPLVRTHKHSVAFVSVRSTLYRCKMHAIAHECKSKRMKNVWRTSATSGSKRIKTATMTQRKTLKNQKNRKRSRRWRKKKNANENLCIESN